MYAGRTAEQANAEEAREIARLYDWKVKRDRGEIEGEDVDYWLVAVRVSYHTITYQLYI